MSHVNASSLRSVLLVMFGLSHGEGSVEVVAECGDCARYWLGELGGLMGVW